MKEIHEYFETCELLHTLANYVPRHIRLEYGPQTLVIHKKVKVSGHGPTARMKEFAHCVITKKDNKIQVCFIVHEYDLTIRNKYTLPKMIKLSKDTINYFNAHDKMHFEFNDIDSFTDFFNEIFWIPKQKFDEWTQNYFKKKRV